MPHHWHHRNPHLAAPTCTPDDCDCCGADVDVAADDDVPDAVASTAIVASPVAVSTTMPDSTENDNDRWRCQHSSCCHRNPKRSIAVVMASETGD